MHNFLCIMPIFLCMIIEVAWVGLSTKPEETVSASVKEVLTKHPAPSKPVGSPIVDPGAKANGGGRGWVEAKGANCLDKAILFQKVIEF